MTQLDDVSESDWADGLSCAKATEPEDSGLTVDGAVSDGDSAITATTCGLSEQRGMPEAAVALAAAQQRRAALMHDALLAPLVQRGEDVFEAIAELNVHHPPSLKPGLVWCAVVASLAPSPSANRVCMCLRTCRGAGASRVEAGLRIHICSASTVVLQHKELTEWARMQTCPRLAQW